MNKDVEFFIAEELQLCSRDFWYYAPLYLRTKDEENNKIRPFPKAKWKGSVRTSTYLYRMHRAIEDNQITCILKPRRMLVSLMILARFQHKATFCGSGIPGTEDVYFAAIMSADEDSAKYQLGRIYDMYDNLPVWLQEINPLTVRNSLEARWKNGGQIKAFPLKQSGAVGFGFSEVLFDECAFQMFARTTYEGTRPTIGSGGKMIVVSTPNGKRNFFYEMWANQGGKYQDVFRLELNNFDHPDRDDLSMQKIAKSMSSQAYARQYLKSFSSAAGKPVYDDEFDENANISDNNEFVTPGRDKPVLMGWDFGYYAPACVFAQFNAHDQLIVQHEVIGKQIDIYDFAKLVREKRAAWYSEGHDFIHLIPHDTWNPYQSKSLHGHKNNYDTLFGPGDGTVKPGRFFRERAYKGAIEAGKRISMVRSLLRLRDDGRAGLVFSQKGCPELIDGCKAGYAYPPEDKITDPDKMLPEKSEYADPHDALQMIVTGYQYIHRIFKTAAQNWNDEFIGHRTGM